MKFSKAFRITVCTLIACVFLYFFPFFRVRTIGAASKAELNLSSTNLSSQGPSLVNASTLIETLWVERLPALVKSAPNVDELLTMAKTDADGALKKYGRESRLGGPTFLFVRGHGQIESVNEEQCRLALTGQSQRIVLEIGILFGNTVRDATGLVKVGDFPNSQDFNNLSTELNTRCESRVIEPVRHQLLAGARVDFAGCGEVRDRDDFSPLKLIPVLLRVVDAQGAEK